MATFKAESMRSFEQMGVMLSFENIREAKLREPCPTFNVEVHPRAVGPRQPLAGGTDDDAFFGQR